MVIATCKQTAQEEHAATLIIVVKTIQMLFAAMTTHAAPEDISAVVIMTVVNRASEVCPNVCCKAYKCEQGDKTAGGIKSAKSSTVIIYHLN